MTGVKHQWRVVVKSLAFISCAMLFALSFPAEAQQPGKIIRIGFLDSSTPSSSAAVLGVFRQELSKFGWIEGKNIIFEYRFAEQKPERLPELAADLGSSKSKSNCGFRERGGISGQERHH